MPWRVSNPENTTIDTLLTGIYVTPRLSNLIVIDSCQAVNRGVFTDSLPLGPNRWQGPVHHRSSVLLGDAHFPVAWWR